MSEDFGKACEFQRPGAPTGNSNEDQRKWPCIPYDPKSGGMISGTAENLSAETLETGKHEPIYDLDAIATMGMLLIGFRYPWLKEPVSYTRQYQLKISAMKRAFENEVREFRNKRFHFF